MLKHVYTTYIKNSYTKQYEAAQYTTEKDGYQFIDVREMDVI